MPTQRRMTVLYRVLDILRIMVHTADDDDVLDAAGHIELAALIEKPEVPGAQPEYIAFAIDAPLEQ